MSQQTTLPSSASLPWLFRGPGRTSAAVLAVAIGAATTRALPVELQIVVSFDLGALVYTLILGVAEKPACPNRLWSILLTA